MITSEQIRAARALLRIDQSDLARRARVSVATVRRMEAAGGIAQIAGDTVVAIQAELEKAGAEFIAGGVRHRPSRRDSEATYRRLREIAERSAAELAGRRLLTDDDLYDEHGLPR